MGEDSTEELTQLNHVTTTATEGLGQSIPNNQPEYTPADLLDEGRSSSLSDLEDGMDDVDMLSAASTLSRQIEADSEAETERLENSPNKHQNHKNIETESMRDTQSPSKLIRPQPQPVAEQEPFSDSAVSSPGPSEEDAESEPRSDHSAVSDNRNSTGEQTRRSSSKKRKHLDMEESGSEVEAETARRQRRRTQSVRSDAGAQSELGLSREATIEPIGELPDHEAAIEGTSNILRNAQKISNSKGSKDAKGNHSKMRGRESLKNIIEEKVDHDHAAGLGAGQARPESDGEERAEGEDEDVEAAARDEEEYAKKMAAMDSLAALEKHFAALRDRLYDERIAAWNDEIAQLSAAKPSHPEYLRQLDCIRKYRDEKFDTEQKLLVYKIKSLKTKSVAQRSQIHSAYFQTVRDVRENHLDRIGERLSRVRRDHVKTEEKVPSFSIPFPTRRSTQITQQTSYNKEVSILSGFAKYVGFPAAPDVKSALQAELDDDLEKMGISLNHVRTSKPTQPKLSRSAFSATMSRPAAEEQFLEQNPWANPQHPVHQQQHIGRLSRQVSDQTQIAEANITPATQQSSADIHRPSGSASTIPEQFSAQASSTLATPYSNDGSVQHQSLDLTLSGIDQQLPAGFVKARRPQGEGRPQSISPTETRRHNLLAHDSGANKLKSTGHVVTGVQGAASHQYRPSRIALFSTAARPDSIARNGPPNDDIGARHATSSPITLHQHARENNLASATGLSRIGAR